MFQSMRVLAWGLLHGNLRQHLTRAALTDLMRLGLDFSWVGCVPWPTEILSPCSAHGAQCHERRHLKLTGLCKLIVFQQTGIW